MITKLNFTDRTIKSYAIRKLTPKECFRLMGVRDNVIGTMQSSNAQAAERLPDWKGKGKPEDMAISASQQYKQAGNSIVVDVLAHIYEQLFYPAPPKPRPGKQLTLFDDPEDTLPALPPTADKNEEKIFLTTFSGYDSQLMAADVLREWHPDFRWTCWGWSDIDKYACQMHNLVFPQFADCALGDITKIDWHEVKSSLKGREVDLFTYSSPCQDISQAGKQMGLQEGSDTRSALLWRVADAVAVLRPKYLLQENVAALVSQKFMPDFQKWLDKLSSLGYVSRWARLNAKNYGVPQNRDRVFCLSMRRDVAFDYQFPEPFKLLTRLEDVLEEEVSGRYFLKDDAVSKFLKANDSDNALFLQFDLPPTHEAAMFLKTVLQIFMERHDGWNKDIEWNERELSYYRPAIANLYKLFKESPKKLDVEYWRGFYKMYKWNLERQKDAN
ncbi:DNA (cytosine-5-)-methyltransferase [Prevotella sp.]|uniref:DNA (cytosine-5-)-methyltransferase n=1 Tax=Prevotella sp. TaxID=59823 RepID=UPI0040286803